MKVRKFTITDAVLERSPGQDGDVFVGNLVDQRHASPITIGYGRYGPDQTLEETMAVDDVMVVLEGRLSVSGKSGSVTAGPGEIVHMPKGQRVARARRGHRLCHLSPLAGGTGVGPPGDAAGSTSTRIMLNRVGVEVLPVQIWREVFSALSQRRLAPAGSSCANPPSHEHLAPVWKLLSLRQRRQ